MIGGVGLTELLIVFLIILIIFGAGKLPKVAKSIGEGIKEFKKAQSDKKGENEKKGEDNINDA